MDIPTLPLSSSLSMPLIGLGTWQLQGELCTQTVKMALDIGYSHIDTAHLYENHQAIGKALIGFKRERLFLTSKFLLSHLEHSTVEKTCDTALKDLKTDFLDLYLLHSPDSTFPMKNVLSDLEKLKATGKVRWVGVSNCTVRHLTEMLSWGFHPSVNQVEFHPCLYQKELLSFCRDHRIELVSYRTLGKGMLLKDSLFNQIGKKYGKSPAQILLRWCIEKNIPVIPKASKCLHLEENKQIFDFSLSKEDTLLLDSVTHQQRFCMSGWSEFNL